MIKPPTSNIQHLTLLMLTRKVDRADTSPAGFTYNWVKKLGERLDKLYVITWQKSDRSNLPENIKIISLSGNKFKKIFTLQKELLKILPKVDGIFCHQNPEYTILCGILAKIYRKKIISWYTHKQVSWKLHLVNLLADKILTASKESCRLKNRKKIVVTGHGIDIEKFKPLSFHRKEPPSLSPPSSRGEIEGGEKFIILSVGRISPVKDYETLIEAIEILTKHTISSIFSLPGRKESLFSGKGKEAILVQIIGAPALDKDKKYFEKLKNLVKRKKLENCIKFLGPIPHNQILPYYQNCDLFINLSQTGSVDKAVLEAMACEKLVITCNEAFANILNDKRLLFEPKNPRNLAQKIINLMNLSNEEKEKINYSLRREVIKNHNLNKLIEKILLCFS